MTSSLSLRCAAVAGTAIALMVAAGAAAWSFGQDAAHGPDAVRRETLVSGAPVAAPGQQLELVRYVIQPGTTLPPHTHPGMQIGFIESGTLRYVVVQGETPVYRKAGEGRSAAVERLGPGQQTDLHAGDSLIEAENVVHYGENRGAEPVVIWCATLLKVGEPPATMRPAGAR